MFFKNAFKGNNSWLRYVLGIAAFMGGYFIGHGPLFLALDKGYEGDISQKEAAFDSFFENPDFGLFGINPNMGFVLLLLIFVFALLALFGIFKTLHQRNFRSLISSENKINWKKIVFAFFFWLVMVMIYELIAYYQDPSNFSFSFRMENFFPLLLLSILVLPIQTTAEEVLFRGYIMQGVGILTNNKWIPLLVTTGLFGLAHIMNPEIEKYGMWVMLSYYLSMGLLLGIIVILDDGLELALGIHAATNFAGSVFVGYEGAAVQTESLAKAATINPLMITFSALISFAIFIFVCSRMYNWPPLKTIFEPILLEETDKL